ncbi:cytochrome c oxidase subunit II [Sediminibacillus albus]|nr:cytochrome c oxidase subunit II [Sediminibacillus albus]
MKKILLLFTMLIVGGCQIRTLDPHSQMADDQAFLIYFSFAIMTVVMLVVFSLLFRFTWKYKETEKNKEDVPEEINDNKRLEISWTLIPVVLLAILAVPTVMITYEISPQATGDSTSANNNDSANHVHVTAERFNWTFEYENGKQSKDLVLPVGKSIVLHLQSADVIHSFWVPELGGKQDVIPGKEILYEVTPGKTGNFLGKCAEFCGMDHALMRFDTEIVSEEKYRRWLLDE